MAEAIVDPKDVALAALTNLVRLMGAELVAGRHRDDVDLLEQAVRTKIRDLNVVGCPIEVADVGLALALSHVERALAQIRVQADEVRVADLKRMALQEQAASAEPPEAVLH